MGLEKVDFPMRVFRGEKALQEVGAFCQSLGDRVFVLGGKTALEKTEKHMSVGFNAAGVEALPPVWYGGECSWANIHALTAQVQKSGADVLVAVGGGKALDTGKMIADATELPLVTVPTIAATCAAITPVSVIYDEKGEFVEMVCFEKCPSGTVIDTEVILHSPLRWLASGMGDTLAKWYEYRVSIQSAKRTGLTLGALSNGRLCYDLIEEFGAAAKKSLEEGVWNEALDATVDAIILYAGMASILGGEQLRSAAAHGFHNGLTKIPGAHEVGHGLIVGYGNLCLLALENRSDAELVEAIEIAKRCAVPTQLKELMVLTDEQLQLVAEATLLTPDVKNMPFAIDAEMIVKAVRRVDALAAKSV